MEVLTTTPFGRRPMTADLVKQAYAAQQPADLGRVDKWDVLRDLTTARVSFGVNAPALTVLSALISFHGDGGLSDNASLVVFPSNAALGERAHGMPESTLRRHLAALVAAGLILRHDSPNGKRYAVRDAGGELVRSFGFDLRPLLVRAAEITDAARATREAAARLKAARERVSLKKRDAVKLMEYAQGEAFRGPWDQIASTLLEIHKVGRRKLILDELKDLERALDKVLAEVTDTINKNTKNMIGNDVDIERQLQNSKTDNLDSEPCLESNRSNRPAPTMTAESPETKSLVPLALVVKACPDIGPYVDRDIRHWHELVAAAHFVRGMMGISPDAWQDALRHMGVEQAAIVLVCMLQNIDNIRSPGGYLRALTRKAEAGVFSSGPMVMALLNGGASS